MEQAVLLNTIDDLRGSSDDLMDQVAINYENSLLVNEIGQTLAKESDIEGIFSKVIKVLHHRLDYDRALVMLSNNDRSRLIYQKKFPLTLTIRNLMESSKFLIRRENLNSSMTLKMSKKIFHPEAMNLPKR